MASDEEEMNEDERDESDLEEKGAGEEMNQAGEDHESDLEMGQEKQEASGAEETDVEKEREQKKENDRAAQSNPSEFDDTGTDEFFRKMLEQVAK